MRWKEAVVFFVAFVLIACSESKGGGGKSAKSSSSGIDSTTDRKVEYMLYTIGEVSRAGKEFGALPGESTTARAGKNGNRPGVKAPDPDIPDPDKAPDPDKVPDPDSAKEVEKKPKSKSMRTLKKIGRMLGKLAPFLGVAGFLVPFILAFFGATDPKLKIIQRGFFEVNDKLDEIDNQLQKIKVLIKSDVQKATYIKVESDITFGYWQMKLMFKEIENTQKGCKTKQQCSREKTKIAERYVKKMERAENALHTLLRGVSGTSSKVQKSLMSVIMTETKCNIPQMMSFYEKMFSLSRQGQMVSTVLQQLQGSQTSVLESTNHWLKNMYAFRDRMYEATNHCYKNVRDNVYNDLKEMSGMDVDDIKIKLDQKYDWIEWVSWILLSLHCFY